jgi:tRNA 2-thiocytidine biosynthesis protein TtcA
MNSTNISTKFPLEKPTYSTKRLESTIRKAMHEYALVDGVERVAVALSGGKDSITMLQMLKRISGRGFDPFEIVAVHVAGAFSCGANVSQKYLQGICDELSVPLIVRESKRTLEELECYSCSRERRSLLFQAAKEASCTTIAFGHHRDDSAETLLLNLLHKGEFAGLLPKVPMHDYGVTIIRPLILATEQEIVTYAKQAGFLRITCQCPVGQKSKRKTVKSFIQEIEAHFPNAGLNLAAAAMNYGSRKALDA